MGRAEDICCLLGWSGSNLPLWPHTPLPSLLSLGQFFQKLVLVVYTLMGPKHFAAGESHVRLPKAPTRCCLAKAPSLKGKKPGRSSKCQMSQPTLSASKRARELVIRSCHKICLFSRNGLSTFLIAHLLSLKKYTS